MVYELSGILMKHNFACKTIIANKIKQRLGINNLHLICHFSCVIFTYNSSILL